MPRDKTNELFWLVDDQDNQLGSVARGVAHADKTKIHRAVSIILIDNQNRTLLQKRSQHKDTYPGYWTMSASGHVDYGETYEASALRELAEELGLSNVLLEYKGKQLMPLENETEYEAIYIGYTDETPTRLDPDEVTEVAWVNITDLPQFIKDNHVTPATIVDYKFLGLLDR